MVDASVAVKWFAPEPDEAAARAVLEDARPLVAPALARVEVAAALVKKAQRREMPAEACARALELWRRSLAADRPVLVADELDLETGCNLALDLAHPLPDCLYLALSIRLGVPLVTADHRFARRAGRSHATVQLLSAFPPAGH
ncbi:MAG: type II toxin-antitoxin system VapC family toxin [Geminicoccales bacterium]